MARNVFSIILSIACFGIVVLASGCSQAGLNTPQPSLPPTITPVQLAQDEDDAPAAAATATIHPTQTASPAPTATLDPSQPVWVGNPEDRSVLAIDPLSNTIVQAIQVRGRPDIVLQVDGQVWALDREGQQVFQVDPRLGQITTRVPLPPGRAETMTAGALEGGASVLWVGMTQTLDLTALLPGEDVPPPQGWIIQIDLEQQQITDRYPVQPVGRLAASGPLLWVLARGEIDNPVQLIDTAGQQGMAVPLRNAPEWFLAEALAADGRNLWLFSSAYHKIFHANTEGYILSAIALPQQPPSGYADLLLAEDSLWAATPGGSLLRIDPASNRIQASLALDVPLSQLIAGHQAVWVHSQQTGALFRIDTDSNQVAARIETGSPLRPTVVPSPTPRVQVWKPCQDAPTSRLKIGDLAYVTKDPPMANRVREEPNREGKILGYISPGGSMTILDGPTCAEGWVWWKVRNANLEGWTAEGDKDTYWLVPLFP